MNHQTHFSNGYASKEILDAIIVIGFAIAGYFALGMRNEQLHSRALYRASAVPNNLRQLYFAAHQYMHDGQINSCTYTDLAGVGPSYPINAIYPVGGEDYTKLVITQTMTQLTISTADGTVYNWP